MAYARILTTCAIIALLTVPTIVLAQLQADVPDDITGMATHRVGSKTDDQTVEREEQAMSHDGFNIAEKKLIKEMAQKHDFQAEVNSLMGILVNSLYSNKEIFLRELISNASDALDKIKYLSLQDSSALASTPELEIRIRFDKEKNLLSIKDTGVGMTQQELIANLGTLAKSGSKEFLTKLRKQQEEGTALDNALIGQFGVGFYAVYLVADAVTVVSKSNNDDQYIWYSDSSSGFSIMKDPEGNTLGRGTVITLEMQPDAIEFLDSGRITQLVKRYSEFIDYPIYLYDCHTEYEEVPKNEDELKLAEQARAKDKKPKPEGEMEVEEEEESMEDLLDDEKAKTKTIEHNVCEWEIVNKHKPIWTRNPSEVTDQEYINFYEALSRDANGPLTYSHFSAEGDVYFRSILYVPSTPPAEMFEHYGAPSTSIKLYVRRVFITDKFEDLMPHYLSFIKGVLDSDDLPLSISREDLSHHRMLKTIRRKLVRKCLDMFKKLQDDEGKWAVFYKAYATNLKLGVVEDSANRTRLSKLLGFLSTASDENSLVTLDQYVSRMREGQKDIYYIAGPVLKDLEHSPFLERLKRKGYEVFLCTDPMDEYVFSTLREHDGHALKDITRDGLDLGDDEKEKETIEAEFEDLTKWLKTKLGDKILKASVSFRLTTSPVAISTAQYTYSANMERLMKAQTMKNQETSFGALAPKKTLELNPRHPIVLSLRDKVKTDPEDKTAVELAGILYDTGLLQSGFTLDDPAGFASRVHGFLKVSLGLDSSAEVDIDSLPQEEAPVKTPELEEEEEEEVKRSEE